MLVFSRNVEKIIGKSLERQIMCCYSTAPETKTETKGIFKYKLRTRISIDSFIIFRTIQNTKSAKC